MISQIPVNELVHDIKAVYASDIPKSEILIEGYLTERLKDLSQEKRLSVLERISSEFKPAISQTANEPDIHSELLSKLYSLLLGKEASKADLSSEDTLARLCKSLNTIFDRLNELINVINTTFSGKAPELETIRHFIGAELGRASPSGCLESYLNRIKSAFLTVHDAFKQAVHIKLQEVLIEFDPEFIETNIDKGLKFGPLLKAECFEIYKQKFKKFKNYYERGRFMDELLREFERKSQKLYLEKKGEI